MTRKKLSIWFFILISMMLIGTFFDYQISQIIYNPSSFIGLIFAGYGQIPAMLCLSISGFLIVSVMNNELKVKRVIAYIICIILSLLSIFIIAVDSLSYITMPKTIAFMIAIIIVLLADLLIYKMTEDVSKQDLKKFVVFLLVTMLLSVVIINIVKIFWGRPRMRMIEVTPEALFQPWWVVGRGIKDLLMGIGVKAEEFKSFPSGHAGNVACLMMLNVLPLLSLKLKQRKEMIFIWTSFIVLVVAFSRVIYGAHFVSDITVGIAITLSIEYILSHLLWKQKYKEEE